MRESYNDAIRQSRRWLQRQRGEPDAEVLFVLAAGEERILTCNQSELAQRLSGDYRIAGLAFLIDNKVVHSEIFEGSHSLPEDRARNALRFAISHLPPAATN